MENMKKDSQVRCSFSFEKNTHINGILSNEINKITSFTNLNNLSSNTLLEINDKKPPVIPIKNFYGFSRTIIKDINGNENQLDPELSPANNFKETQTKREKFKKKVTLAKKRINDVTEENAFSRNSNEFGAFTNKKKETSPIIKGNLNMTKLYKLISQFYIVKKFIILLLDSTIYRRAKKLTKKHYDIIRDESFFIDRENNNVWCEEDRNSKPKNASIAFRMMNIPSFHPNRSFRILWDLIHLFIIIILFIIIPIEMGFGISLLKNELKTLLYIVFSFFLFDIVVNLKTGYYKNGELILDHSKIFWKYFGWNMMKDFLSIIYLLDTLVNSSIYNYYFGLLFFLRIFNLNQITKRIFQFLFMDETTYYILYLLKLIFGILFFSHIFACIWSFIGENSFEEDNWIKSMNLTQEEWYSKYLNSFYYVVVVMNTVGFGDVTPKNSMEKLFSIFFIYLACWVFAFSLNIIGIILQNLNRKNDEFVKAILLINAYMKQHHINFDLRIRVHKYIEYIWKQEKVQNEEKTQGIISKLSKSLKEELLLNANGPLFRKLPLFSLNFSEDSLKKLVYTIREISLTPGDILYFQNDKDDDHSIYIINKGQMEYFIETEPIKGIGNVKNGFFGEKSFFTGNLRECGARSSTFTSLYVIRKQDFINIIKNNAEDYEKFCFIRDKIILNGNLEDLYLNCDGCRQDGHCILDCPFLKLNINKERTLMKYNFDQGQKRNTSPRRDNKKKRAYMSQDDQNEFLKRLNDLSSDQLEDDEEDEHANEPTQLVKQEDSVQEVDLPKQHSQKSFLDKKEAFTPKSFSDHSDSQRKKGKTVLIQLPSKDKDKDASKLTSFKSILSLKGNENSQDLVKFPSLLFKDNNDSRTVDLMSPTHASRSRKKGFSFTVLDSKILENDQKIIAQIKVVDFDLYLCDISKSFLYYYPDYNIDNILRKMDYKGKTRCKIGKVWKKLDENFSNSFKLENNINISTTNNLIYHDRKSNFFKVNEFIRNASLSKEKVIEILRRQERKKKKQKRIYFRIIDWIFVTFFRKSIFKKI